MTAWAKENVPVDLRRIENPAAFVVEAAGGIVRTVLGSMRRGELYVALREDNPLCGAMLHGPLRVTEADGRAYDAHAHDVPPHEAADTLITELQDRLACWRAGESMPAKVYRLVLGTMLGPEQAFTPRT